MAQTSDPSARLPRVVHRVQPRESIINPDALTKRLTYVGVRGFVTSFGVV